MWPAIIEAKEFAAKKHAGQKYGTLPYTYHLNAVFEVAVRYHLSNDICVASCLHDVLEDTDVSYVELRSFFGPHVADLVRLVTDEPGENRWERARKTLPKTRTDPDAVALKLCDRIANVQACLDGIGNVDLVKAYRKEYVLFKEALYRAEEKELQPLWSKLDQMNFPG